MRTIANLKTREGIAEQFKAMQKKMVFLDPYANVSDMMEAFFERMIRSDIGPALETFEDPPEGTDIVMLQFYRWLANHSDHPWLRNATGERCYLNLARLVKQMQLIREDGPFTQMNRFFIWTPQSTYFSVKLPVEYEMKKTWYASASVRAGHSVEKTRMDNTHSGQHAKLYITECNIKEMKLPTFAYSVEFGRKILGTGFKATQIEAAEAAYHLFYEALTAFKYGGALEPKEGKEVVIYGNWMSEDEYNKARNTKPFQYAVAVIKDDERNDQVFVIGLQRFTKEKITSRIKRIQRAGRPYMDSSSFSLDVTFENGAKLSASLDWKVVNPEQHIEGEVYCKQCKQLYGGIGSCDMRMVETVGPLCGPCRDHLQDNGHLDDTLILV